MGAENESVSPRFALILYVIVALICDVFLLFSFPYVNIGTFRLEKRDMMLAIIISQIFAAFLQVRLILRGNDSDALDFSALAIGVHLFIIIIYLIALGVRYFDAYLVTHLVELGETLTSFGYAIWVPASAATLVVSTAVAVMRWNDPRTSSVATFFAFVALLALLATLI